MSNPHQELATTLLAKEAALLAAVERRYAALAGEDAPRRHEQLAQLLGFLTLAATGRNPALFADAVAWMHEPGEGALSGREVVLAVRATREALLDALPLGSLGAFAPYARAAFDRLSALAWTIECVPVAHRAAA